MSDLEEPPEPTDPNDPTELPEPMNNIDKLTLELLINKSQYKKYVQKNDPAKYSENQVYLGKIQKYSYKIEQLFSSLLENPDQQITTDVNREFTHFVKTCIQYFELKEMECVAEDHNGDPIDDETLFGTIDDSVASSSSSLWGHKIKKSGGSGPGSGPGSAHGSVGSAYMPKYTMDSYVRTKKS
jgi:hypothetical protein